MSDSASAPPAQRPVTPADDLFLYRLYCTTREEEFASLPLPPEQKEALLKMQFEGQNSGYAVQFPDSEHTLLLSEGEPAGRIWVNETDKEILIVDLAVLPEYRGRGIGGAAVRSVMERAAKSGKPLRHVVLKHNQRAIRFDLGLGYSVIDDDGVFLEMEWSAKSRESAA